MEVKEKNPSRLILVASGTLSGDSKRWALENSDHSPEGLELVIVINKKILQNLAKKKVMQSCGPAVL